jgi:hypothetical protein
MYHAEDIMNALPTSANITLDASVGLSPNEVEGMPDTDLTSFHAFGSAFEEQTNLYQQMAGSVMYASLLRPDLMYYASQLGKVMSRPSLEHGLETGDSVGGGAKNRKPTHMQLCCKHSLNHKP